jgi:SAM-dependent methyltransferase
VLDVGCLNGHFLELLTETKDIEAHGVDIFDMKKISHPEINFYSMHGMDVSRSWANYFDYITCFDVLEHTFNDIGTLRAMEQALKRGGTMIINLPKPRKIQVDDPIKALKDNPAPEHLRPYNKEDVLELVGRQKDLTFHSCKDEDGGPTWFFSYKRD